MSFFRSGKRGFWWATGMVVALGLLSCMGPPPRPPEVARGDIEAVRAYLRQLIAYERREHKIQGLSIALVEDQTLIWAEGFGHADVANRIEATPDTLYRIGSITKLFNAVAALQLAEQGQLDLDRPIQDYLPDFAIRSRFTPQPTFTARQLMTHHAGLPTDYLNGWNSEEPIRYVRQQLKDEYVAYPPDTVWAYSNLGATVLGHVVETRAGAPYADWLKTRVLSPIGMEKSYVAARLEPDAHLAKPYDEDGKPADSLVIRDIPAGGMVSNVVELGHFMRTVFKQGQTPTGQTLLRPETLADMMRRQNQGIPLDFDLAMGLGWAIDNHWPEPAGPLLWHGGSDGYFNAQLAVLPEQRLGVVVLANSAGAMPAVMEVAKAALQALLQAKTGIAPPPERDVRQLPEVALSAQQLHPYAGAYETVFGFVEVGVEGQRLWGQSGSDRVELVPIGEDEFRIEYPLWGLIPAGPQEWRTHRFHYVRVGSEELLLVVNDRGARRLVGIKIHPMPIPPAWRARLGHYAVPDALREKINRMALRQDDRGFLYLEFDGERGATLQPLSDREAVIAGLGRGKQETVRAEEIDGMSHLYYWGLVHVKLRD
jgi:CubicO group peptidase (beta-lactamase class C family)